MKQQATTARDGLAPPNPQVLWLARQCIGGPRGQPCGNRPLHTGTHCKPNPAPPPPGPPATAPNQHSEGDDTRSPPTIEPAINRSLDRQNGPPAPRHHQSAGSKGTAPTDRDQQGRHKRGNRTRTPTRQPPQKMHLPNPTPTTPTHEPHQHIAASRGEAMRPGEPYAPTPARRTPLPPHGPYQIHTPCRG